MAATTEVVPKGSPGVREAALRIFLLIAVVTLYLKPRGLAITYELVIWIPLMNFLLMRENVPGWTNIHEASSCALSNSSDRVSGCGTICRALATYSRLAGSLCAVKPSLA